MGGTIGLIEGDTRSLDYSSCLIVSGWPGQYFARIHSEKSKCAFELKVKG